MNQGQFIPYLPRFHHSSRHIAATPSTFSIYLATFTSSPTIRYLRVHAFISVHENKDQAGEVIIAREENVTLHATCLARRTAWSNVGVRCTTSEGKPGLTFGILIPLTIQSIGRHILYG